MPHWIYFLHAPRERFAETISDEEQAIMGRHADYLDALLQDGALLLAGPTLGPVNTGIAIYEAPDEAAAQAIHDADPSIQAGLMRGELRPFRASFVRGG
jgi:uncharacterized protein YciI